jgi:hypothetical protein
MTGYSNSHLVPFLENTSAPSMLILREHNFVENSQLLDCPNNFVFDGLPSYPEVPPRGIVLTSNHNKPNPKVPISRTNTPTSWSSRSRVSQACKACRELKTKCSGHRPACHRCKDLGIDCNYSERKRELINKYVAEKNSHMIFNANIYQKKNGGLGRTR